MVSLLTTFAITAAVSVLLTALVRWAARRLGVVDRPDGKRKLHKRSIPLWGGVAVYLSMSGGLLVARAGSFGVGPAMDELAAVLVAVAGFVCLLGAIDDLRPLPSRLKLLLQMVAVLPIVCLGHWVDRLVLFGYPLELGWLGIPLTVFWLVGCINALNLLDGMDGLASIVGLSTAAMVGIIAISEGHPHVSAIGMTLAGALAGFLVYNLPPATIFLGDSGSMVIGLVIGMLGLQGSLKTSATLSLTAPAVVMALPMMDIVLAVVRRKLTGRRFDTADRQHIHHRLLDRGLTPWQVLCILGAVCLTTGGAATAATIFRNDALAWITTLTLFVLAVRLRWFGHYELSLLKRTLARGLAALAGRLVAADPDEEPPTAEELAAASYDEAWQMLVEDVRAWRVSRVELSLSDGERRLREQVWSDPQAGQIDPACWSVARDVRLCNATVCELRATLGTGRGPELLCLAGLTRVLDAYAARFAAELESIPPLVRWRAA